MEVGVTLSGYMGARRSFPMEMVYDVLDHAMNKYTNIHTSQVYEAVGLHKEC